MNYDFCFVLFMRQNHNYYRQVNANASSILDDVSPHKSTAKMRIVFVYSLFVTLYVSNDPLSIRYHYLFRCTLVCMTFDPSSNVSCTTIVYQKNDFFVTALIFGKKIFYSNEKRAILHYCAVIFEMRRG